MLICITHSRDQPPFKSTLFSAQSVRKISATKNQQMGDVYSTFLNIIIDKDKYKLSLEFVFINDYI